MMNVNAREVFKEKVNKLGYNVLYDIQNYGYNPGIIRLIPNNLTGYFIFDLRQFPSLCGIAVISNVSCVIYNDKQIDVIYNTIFDFCRDLNYTRIFISLTTKSFRYWQVSKKNLESWGFKELIPTFTNKRTRHKIWTFYKEL